ncbi:hypothetical protein SAMN02745687_01364 [Lachnospiraceae bacterium NK3A20]|jgi:predicted RNA-binding protein YlxR (DUF448 family)|nr:hypothetical protein SAMN02745687_01364 [Lachnospiraceae bacterium NK3A20]
MPKKIPMRSCTGCGEKKEKSSLIRVIRTPEGTVKLDPTGRAPGRGTYLCPNPDCLQKARKKHALSRSLGVEIPKETLDLLETELRNMSGGANGT